MYDHEEEAAFVVRIRREPGVSRVAVAFECKRGLGEFHWSRTGPSTPVARSSAEESDLDLALLRAGRFVYVNDASVRRAFSFHRIAHDVVERLPDARWVDLEQETELGFRTLVVPESRLQARQTTARVRVTPEPAPRVQAPRVDKRPRPQRSGRAAVPKGEAALRAEVADLRAKLAESRARERDLIALVTKWSQSEE